jgi:ornithine decarboxylase
MSRFVELARNSYTSIAVYSPYTVRNRLRWWNELLPTIRPYYAIKSFDNPHILHTTGTSGLIGGFDVASRGEIEKVAKYGLPMIHSNPVKLDQDILSAKDNDVTMHVCDDLETIKQVRRIQPNAKIVWRIKSMEQFSRIRFNEKFGSSIRSTGRIIRDLRKESLGSIFGLSFHVGSACSNMAVFLSMMNHIERDLFPKWQKASMPLPKLIDIGGGFRSIDGLYSVSKELTQLTRDWKKRYNIDFISEPGRYISEDSIRLYTRVIAVKKRDAIYNRAGKRPDHYNIHINDSIYQSFSGILYDQMKPTPEPTYEPIRGVKNATCTIWGNTCDGCDKILDSVRIPIPRLNDVIQWRNMGAYTLVSGTVGFNGFNPPRVVSVDETDDQILIK